MSIKENLLKISSKLKDESVLIAVSKTFQTDDIVKAHDEGIKNFGENYLDEALKKIEYFKSLKKYADIKWHYLGRIQSKKINKMVGVFNLIHTVASLDHIKKINQTSLTKKIKQKILIQVKHQRDERDYGISFDLFSDFMKDCMEFNNINLCGLMYLPPQNLNQLDLKESFKKAQSLLKENAAELKSNDNDWNVLSMGMSADFELALEEGATHIRIGRGIFGDRLTEKGVRAD